MHKKKKELKFNTSKAENALYEAGCFFSEDLFVIKDPKERRKLLRDYGLNEEDFYEEEKKEGCYIATCVYGSYNHPNVRALRSFRDNTLSKSIFGRLFISVYYFISPTFVKYFGHLSWMRKFCRMILDWIVEK